ncbi:MAG: hypothetical protein GEU78_09740 [Actinobacteria bacterium]|nr:hypothetical protein [Actinomycetota bacterium]
MSDEGAGPRSARPRPITAVVWALIAAAILVPLMLFLGRDQGPTAADVTGYLKRESPGVEQRSEEVLDLLVNYDAETLEGVIDDMLAISTGNFREQYEEIVTRGLNDAISEASASSEGKILQGPQVTFASASRAVSLASVEQTTRSGENPEGRTFTYLVRLTLVRSGDEWKADRIEILSGEVA